MPAWMATAVVMLLTVTGVGMGVTGCWSPGELGLMAALLPSSPQVLSPQQRTLPSWRSAQVCQPAAEIATAPEIPATVTGVEAVVTVPSPSWPDSFAPQQRTAPS